jgi:hypothetical protein
MFSANHRLVNAAVDGLRNCWEPSVTDEIQRYTHMTWVVSHCSWKTCYCLFGPVFMYTKRNGLSAASTRVRCVPSTVYSIEIFYVNVENTLS